MTDHSSFDVQAVRGHFPALARQLDGKPLAFLDGPAGTQVPRECIDAIVAYLEHSNANHGGAFITSHETDAMMADVHAAAADFLGAADASETSFGANMTTLTFAVSRAIGKTLTAGDEIVVTQLDHDGDVAPWLAVAEERGLVIKRVGYATADCRLDLDTLAAALTPRTRIVAVTLASNAVGTIPPVRRIADMAHAAGARLWVDAVHAGPHMPIDVAALGADYLICSPYKFYGPHLGLLWAHRDLLETLPAYKVRPASEALPGRWETGTQSHEMLAGLAGTFRYLEWIGVSQGGATGEPGAADGGRRARLSAAMHASRAYERSLIPPLLDGLASVPGLTIYGITDPAHFDERCPTVSFTLARHHPRAVAEALGARGIFAWDGDYYAYELIRSLGLADSGGMVRVGLVHYNTLAEVERLVEALNEIQAG